MIPCRSQHLVISAFCLSVFSFLFERTTYWQAGHRTLLESEEWTGQSASRRERREERREKRGERREERKERETGSGVNRVKCSRCWCNHRLKSRASGSLRVAPIALSRRPQPFVPSGFDHSSLRSLLHLFTRQTLLLPSAASIAYPRPPRLVVDSLCKPDFACTDDMSQRTYP